MKKVLIYSPYGSWDLHTCYEITIAHALKLRGADVKFITCDAVYSDCDVAWKVTKPRNAETCKICMKRTLNIFQQMKMPLEWLSRYIDEPSVEKAHSYVEGLGKEELQGAMFRGRPVGDWSLSSLHSHFRLDELVLNREQVVRTYRSYILSTCKAIIGLEKAIEHYQPDSTMTFNGRFFSHKAFLCLARERGLPCLLHERGLIEDSLSFWQDTDCHDRTGCLEMCRQWRDVPLSGEQCEKVLSLLHRRETGDVGSWQQKFAAAWKSEPTTCSLRQALGIASGKRVIALFTSSEDEIASLGGRDNIIPQREMIQRSIAFVAQRPELQLVIRLHPDLEGPRGMNEQFLSWVRDRLLPNLPNNVIVVGSKDKINSYELVRQSTHCITFGSTLTLEAALLQTPPLVCKRGYFNDQEFSTSLENAASFEQELSSFLQKKADAHSLTHALRFAYAYFFRFSIPFPLVSVVKVHHVKTNFISSEELLPGQDENLDLICANILEGAPIYPSPNKDNDFDPAEEQRVVSGLMAEREGLLSTAA